MPLTICTQGHQGTINNNLLESIHCKVRVVCQMTTYLFERRVDESGNVSKDTSMLERRVNQKLGDGVLVPLDDPEVFWALAHRRCLILECGHQSSHAHSLCLDAAERARDCEGSTRLCQPSVHVRPARGNPIMFIKIGKRINSINNMRWPIVHVCQ